jgi:hypothetical protein
LGQLNVDVENEELRGIYHFVKRCVFLGRRLTKHLTIVAV